MASPAAAPSAARCRSQRRSAPPCRGSACSSVRMVSASPGTPAASTGRARVEDQQQRGRSGRRQQDPPRVIRDSIRVAAVRCCGWERSLPIGILHRQLLGVGVRPGRCPGPAVLSDLVLGGMLGVVPGLVPDHAGVQHPPRRGGRGHRSWEPALTRPTGRGAVVTGMSITTSSFSADARSWRPTTRPRNVSTSQRRDHAASQRPGASGLTRPAAPAGRDRRYVRSVGGGARDGHPRHRQP
jgi:hypothetical protein